MTEEIMPKELNKMHKKKAVVKYKNGEIIKGWVEDFRLDQESFIFFPFIEYSESYSKNQSGESRLGGGGLREQVPRYAG